MLPAEPTKRIQLWIAWQKMGLHADFVSCSLLLLKSSSFATGFLFVKYLFLATIGNSEHNRTILPFLDFADNNKESPVILDTKKLPTRPTSFRWLASYFKFCIRNNCGIRLHSQQLHKSSASMRCCLEVEPLWVKVLYFNSTSAEKKMRYCHDWTQ